MAVWLLLHRQSTHRSNRNVRARLNGVTILIDGYVKGTKPWVGGFGPLRAAPGELVRPPHVLSVFVSPVVGTPGKNWTGRIVFIDQFHRKHKSGKFEFVFIGPKEKPAKTP